MRLELSNEFEVIIEINLESCKHRFARIDTEIGFIVEFSDWRDMDNLYCPFNGKTYEIEQIESIESSAKTFSEEREILKQTLAKIA